MHAIVPLNIKVSNLHHLIPGYGHLREGKVYLVSMYPDLEQQALGDPRSEMF